MIVLHLVEKYLALTESWIYPQVTGRGRWDSVVGTFHRLNQNDYPCNEVLAFSDSWPVFEKRGLRNLITRFPEIPVCWLRRQLQNYGFDVMHCHFGDLAYHAIPLKESLNVPMVTMFYGFDASLLPTTNPVWRTRYLKLFSKGDVFLVEGTNMKKTLVGLGCPESKIRIFHIGVDLDAISFEEKHLSRGGELRVLFAGSFREKKGLLHAIEAFAIAKQEYQNMRLTIIGDARNDEEGRILKQRVIDSISHFGIHDRVALLGFQPHERLIAEFQRHHLFISPSVVAESGDTEGGAPVAITEASASGLPIVGTFHCDIPEVVQNERTGLLTTERDVNGLSESILYFAKNPEKIPEFGRNGRAHIESEYNLNHQLVKLGAIYEELRMWPRENIKPCR